jgi:hypothetical protein
LINRPDTPPGGFLSATRTAEVNETGATVVIEARWQRWRWG